MTANVDTRDRVLRFLRRDPRTVRELAEALGVTPNAARDHVSALEAEGLVVAARLRRGTGGKPARVYDLTPAGEEAFPKPYAEVLTALVAALEEDVGREETLRHLTATAELAAEGLPAAEAGTVTERLEHAVAVVNEMGAMADVVEADGCPRIESHGCPLSAVIRERPVACRFAEALVEALSGVPVREVCRRNGRPRCAFEIVG